MTHRSLRLVVAAAVLGGTLLVPIAPAVAQDYSCDAASSVEVKGLAIDGNHAFSDGFLRKGIATEPSSLLQRWLNPRGWFTFLGTRRCIDSVTVRQDAARLTLFYRAAGYLAVKVDSKITPLPKQSVSVRFTIHEGEPTIVGKLEILGLDSVPDRSSITRKLPLRNGRPFSRDSLAATVDSIRRRLRNDGYPAADVLQEYGTDSVRRAATVKLTAETGRRAVLGRIDVVVRPRDSTTQQISDTRVRQLLGLKSGALYKAGDLERASKNLYFTQDYRSVLVDPDSADVQPPGDSVVAVRVHLTEGLMHSGRLSGGWGTLDCFRTDGDYHDYDFLHSAWQFESTARLSKIGIGRPLAGAAPLCWELRNDPYSTTLNDYLGFTFTAPTTLSFGMLPSLTLYSETRSEFNAYLRTTPVGLLLAATRQSTNRRTQTLSYQLELGRTEAQPAIFCALQNLCLAEDRDPLLATRLTAVAGWAVSQDWSNDPQNPTYGGVGKVELRHASKAIGSDARIQFSKATVDASAYVGLGHGLVLAPRLRVGAVVGPAFSGTSDFIPSQERLFAGGGNTVRGFNQNDLGPKVYIAGGYDTVRANAATTPIRPTDTVYFRTPPGVSAQRSVPTGGSALVVGNIELRVPSPWRADLLQFSFFTDAGELWSPGAAQAEDRYRGLKVTPGAGVRIATPVGAFRVDIAYNAYAPRAGAAFYDTPVSAGGQLYCVSPGNTLAVTGIGPGLRPVQASGTCPRDFQPPSVRGFLNRLTLQFGIGQAY